MAKASRPGNQAVAGITPAVTNEEKFPAYYAQNNVQSSSSGTGSSAVKGNTGTKSSTSTSVKSSSSTSTKSNTGSNTGSNAGGYVVPEVQETPYDQKFYAALSAGIPNGINAGE